MTPSSIKEEIDRIHERLAAVETKTATLYDVVIIGSSEPSHREVIRLMAKFLVDNEKLPETVRTQGRWIENVNWGIRAILTVLIGILVLFAWNTFIHPLP